jgi:hypothetical protein
MTRAPALNTTVTPSIKNRRRRNRLYAEIPGWILPTICRLANHAPSEDEGWEVRIHNVSRFGIGFVSTERLRIGEEQRIRIGRGPMNRSRMFRVVACRESDNETYIIGGEFIDSANRPVARAG